MSAVTSGELLCGAARGRHKSPVRRNLDALAAAIPPCALPVGAGHCGGEVRAAVERRGTPIGSNDPWIAAHALAIGLTPVTNNARAFKRVRGPAVESRV